MKKIKEHFKKNKNVIKTVLVTITALCTIALSLCVLLIMFRVIAVPE